MTLTRTQFLFVVCLLWGWFAARSVMAAFGMLPDFSAQPVFGNGIFLRLAIHELIAGGIAVFYLRRKGWNLAPGNLDITKGLTAAGLFLFVLIYPISLLAYEVGISLGGSSEPLTQFTSSISIDLPVAVLTSMVNGAYEELFLVGFVFKALERHETSFIVGVSVLLRVLAHVYQGPIGATQLFFFGVLFAGGFARYRRLWPLIVAHVMCDVVALMHW